jgi:hypothetical protein
MLEYLGPAAGPYRTYLDGAADLAAKAGRSASLFDVYRMYRQHADAAIDLGAALLEAAATDMIDENLHAAIEVAAAAFVDASSALARQPEDVDAQDEMVGAAFELAQQVRTWLEGHRR